MRTADAFTIIRVILTPVVMWLILSDRAVAALCVFASGSMTDVLDGYFARRSKTVTAYGPTFDALADFALVYGTTLALILRGEAFWLLVVALISMAYLTVVIGLISRRLGRFTIPHLDTTLFATSVHSTIMAYIIGWQYAEIVLAVAVAVALYYAGKYAVFALSLQKRPTQRSS